MSRSTLATFVLLLQRDVRARFIGSASGWIWLILNPLLLLAVYSFVFGVIFQARVPPGLEMPFVAWLAVALWPWLMFSEGVLKGSQSIREHAALISKVSLPRELLVFASVSAVFLLHLAGYLAVFLVLVVLGIDLHWAGLPRLLLALVSLFVLTSGLALGLSAIQVYVRDLEQALPTVMMFWFFLTPILYAPSLLPSDLGAWLDLNPLTWWMAEIRGGILHAESLPGWPALAMLLGSLAVAWAGHRIFRRLSPYFEDFL
ncbi:MULTISPECIES: ABC transporter permease [unclassified Wenzhouxiangella]|uniref:ABC transporter permease n=1 Tax=unclassified Wenzhouxiangella TaxID=2613841 RepID=UPI000E32BB01|nr:MULTISPECIES: ABC transporter permease [unclassified Wenzhouxiangella]RFF26528.1 phosphate ABC transporter permease [Wenzhouxiangella sp. 15181]RFP67517.1 phosphate ABC transporter permease [Wenzhouxiangella sp. 15190]